MPFTREFIRKAAKESGIEIPKELEDALVQEHLSARDAFSAEKVRAALAENQPDPAPKVKETQEYKDLKKEFEDYKAGVSAKEARAAKEAAVRAYYQTKGITGKALDIAMRGSGAEIEAVELGEDGKIRDAAALEALVKGDFAGLVGETHGAPTSHPPRGSGGGKTKEDILKIRDAGERQSAMAENHELFGF